jgi:DMSO/TMAO reductase YedYZ molybdopterin-dependent catalytic subunit
VRQEKNMRWDLACVTVLGLLVCSAADDFESNSPSQVDAPEQAILEVVNEGGKTFSFTSADLAKLPQEELKARDHRGEEAMYGGVLVASVLKLADVALGERLRGTMLTNHLIAEARDKYRALFSLPEIDPDWSDGVVLLATSRNGEPLGASHGPLQIIVPGDKRHSRWIKQVTRLIIRSDSN